MLENTPEQVVLVGPMGAGKTTIGKMLAKELGYDFYDSDKVIEERSGADIPWIFDVEGEQGFRERERQAIKDLAAKRSIVLATGGGAMMDQANRENVRRNGFVVYLNTSVEKQFQRTKKDRNRPLIRDKSQAFQVLSDLYAKRNPVFLQVADMEVDTNSRQVRCIVKMIVARLRGQDEAPTDEEGSDASN